MVTPKIDQRVRVECVCGNTHSLRNTKVSKKLIDAFMRGELQKVTPTGIKQMCLLIALEDIDLIERVGRKDVTKNGNRNY